MEPVEMNSRPVIPNAFAQGIVTFAAILASHAAPIVDTGQGACFDDHREITAPGKGSPFFGQDAQYRGAPPRYRDNGDGTVTDLNTGLMWSKAVDPVKVNLPEAEAIAKRMKLGSHTDWRVPTIKELYSLIDFRGRTGSAQPDTPVAPTDAVPYINTDYFDFLYGDPSGGERYIDAQWLSSTRYVSRTMDGQETLFGVNFADGRIKGYGLHSPRGEKKFYARYVRGNPYGENDFVNNGDGTVTDRATGLMWSRQDSGKGMSWAEALQLAKQSRLAGHTDWRLPNAKELQSIVDYTRSPDTTHSAAIDPVFQTTAIENEAGQRDWPYFWTSTTHLDGPDAGRAAYIAFGRAIGQMHGRTMDVHGAGAQRSDLKTGSPRLGQGPQGDAQRSKNFVRLVRGGLTNTPSPAASKYPKQIRVGDRSYAPAPAAADRAGDFVGRLDRNGDGKVSKDEFDGPSLAFPRLDRNHDGFLEESEAPTEPRDPHGF